MAFDKNSNQFTFIFAIILVAVVGVVLAVTFIGLKPEYDENVKREKMQNILAAMNIEVLRDEAPAMYETTITESLVVDNEGNPVEGIDPNPVSGTAFQTDVLMQYKSWKAGEIDFEDIVYPVYVGKQEGQTLFVLPMVGTGLWGPVWGYVAVQEDGRTIYGSTFDHKGETPGLGAEISTPYFENQFEGKTFTDDGGEFTSITVYKGGTQTRDPHGVDGISGGTITSQGVHEMLKRTLAVYDKFLQSATQNSGQAAVQASGTSTSTATRTASIEADVEPQLNIMDQ